MCRDLFESQNDTADGDDSLAEKVADLLGFQSALTALVVSSVLVIVFFIVLIVDRLTVPPKNQPQTEAEEIAGVDALPREGKGSIISVDLKQTI